jgi:hypothetical protein
MMHELAAGAAAAPQVPWLEIVGWGSPLVIACIGAVAVGLRALWRLAATNQRSATAQEGTAEALRELSDRFANFADEVQRKQSEQDARLAVIEYARDHGSAWRTQTGSAGRTNEPDSI